jgi:hypothetical protein
MNSASLLGQWVVGFGFALGAVAGCSDRSDVTSNTNPVPPTCDSDLCDGSGTSGTSGSSDTGGGAGDPGGTSSSRTDAGSGGEGGSAGGTGSNSLGPLALKGVNLAGADFGKNRPGTFGTDYT